MSGFVDRVDKEHEKGHAVNDEASENVSKLGLCVAEESMKREIPRFHRRVGILYLRTRFCRLLEEVDVAE